MSGYDGPSFFRHKKKETNKFPPVNKTNDVSQINKRAQKTSLSKIPYQKTDVNKKKRSSTPFNPKKLPPKEYFEHRYNEGLNDSNKIYSIIRSRLKKSDQDILLFENENRMKKSIDVKNKSQVVLKNKVNTTTGLNRKLEDIFVDNGHIQIKNPEKFI